jgi:hypothetical protein
MEFSDYFQENLRFFCLCSTSCFTSLIAEELYEILLSTVSEQEMQWQRTQKKFAFGDSLQSVRQQMFYTFAYPRSHSIFFIYTLRH